MNISWYYYRLRSMCLGEIIWRIKRLLWQIYARFSHKRWQSQYERGDTNPTKILEMLEKVNFYGLSAIRPEDVPRNWAASTIAAADKLMQHRYSYLALGEIDLGEEINWNHEYKRGINTPLSFGPWMDYRDTDSFGDFKYFWELPRLQHLITVAKAYFLTSDKKYANEVIEQIKGFVEQSPYLLGVNWIMPMEASIRLISISWITAFLREYLRNNAEACSLIEQIVKSHVNYVVKNYAAYSSANNHLVAEAAGVFIAGICFSQLDKMNTHREKACNILCEEIHHQHYPDGVNKEQAVHYQIFVFDFFLLAALLAKASNIDFPNQYWEMLEKSANFIAAIADNCLVPDIGDSDGGKVVLLSETGCDIVQSVLATSAVLFERGDFKAKAKSFDDMSFWLLGKKGRDKFEALSVKAVPIENKFSQGSYYILSSNNKAKTKVIFDCGPLGFESIAAHGHADSLSFVLSAYGRPYLVDPGTYTYIAKNPFRNYFRSTAAHNTIVVDGQNQSQMAGPFLWSHKANSRLEEWTSDSRHDRVVGCHDGYHTLQDPVTHRRAIKLDKKEQIVTIDDYLEMEDNHSVEQCFHLAPGCHAEMFDSNIWHIVNAGKKIELIADNQLNCRTYTGSENPKCGWFSGAYDIKQPIDTVVCKGTFRGNQRFTTRIKLSP